MLKHTAISLYYITNILPLKVILSLLFNGKAQLVKKVSRQKKLKLVILHSWRGRFQQTDAVEKTKIFILL